MRGEKLKQQRCAVVVGGGVMGGDIASIFFAAGWDVQVVEPNPATRARLPESVPAAATTIYPHLHRNTEPSQLVRDLVENGHFGVKSASRKGFYQWDEASIAREKKRYQIALMKAMQILRDEEEIDVANAP